jgi:predicted DCC family thiol-disulfide oxidoreductase YuxK
MSATAPENHPVLLFDGVCNLCNGVVQFLVPRDPDGTLRFASLQSEAAAELLAECDLPSDSTESVVLVEDGTCYEKSAAAIRVAEHLGGVYALASVFRYVPRRVRDALYDFVAERRYRWFGKRERCMVPSPDLRSRFLE